LKLTLLSLGFFLTFSIGFSQTEKRINGKVVSETNALQDIDIVNITAKKVTSSDNNGYFTISAKVNDELYIISKKYIDRKIVVTQKDFDNHLIILMSEKPIELEEVKITGKPLGGYKVTQADIDLIKLEKQISRPVNQSVYTGEIVNGMDFVRIGKEIINLFKKKEEDKKPAKLQIVFKDYVKDNFQEDFYTKTLGLKPDEIFRFLEFCDADPSAKTIANGDCKLAVMEFLLAKNKAFKKLD